MINTQPNVNSIGKLVMVRGGRAANNTQKSTVPGLMFF